MRYQARKVWHSMFLQMNWLKYRFGQNWSQLQTVYEFIGQINANVSSNLNANWCSSKRTRKPTAKWNVWLISRSEIVDAFDFSCQVLTKVNLIVWVGHVGFYVWIPFDRAWNNEHLWHCKDRVLWGSWAAAVRRRYYRRHQRFGGQVLSHGMQLYAILYIHHVWIETLNEPKWIIHQNRSENLFRIFVFFFKWWNKLLCFRYKHSILSIHFKTHEVLTLKRSEVYTFSNFLGMRFFFQTKSRNFVNQDEHFLHLLRN